MKILDQWQGILQNFIWAGKKPRIKMKSMCDLQDNGGLQVPNLRTYFEAVCLSWLRNWITLEDDRLLKLEGFGLRYGWHAYLAYDKKKVDSIFACHIIQKVLFMVWTKYKICYCEKKPIWPLEVIKLKVEFNENMKIRYEEMITIRNEEMVLKDEEALKERFGWWNLLQIQNLFVQDKRGGGIK